MTRDNALNALRAHHFHAEQVRAQLEQETAELVAAARNAHPPATWPQIADALGGADAGKYAQNVRRKYMPLLDVTVQVKPAADPQP
ncbi:hypothetical protein ACIBCR_15285 [Micromonospora echinospora]|uniref:hypothetical protein n=1 Tax=Micromonospora echinospora TaxID=1877 RepID=UPI0037B6552B